MLIGVTGGTGFLGRYLLREFTEAGHTCRCWARPDSDRSGLDDLPGLEWVPGELGDETTAHDLVKGCDAIVHSALYRPGAGFRGAEGDLVTFLERNVIGTIRLIEAARNANVARFVFMSTCAVHEHILPDRKLDEAHPLWPTSHYGAHKAAIEKHIHAFGLGTGYDVCALRPTGIYGVAHPATNSKWADLVRNVANGETITVSRGGKEVHAADVARATTLLLTADGIAGQAYNCFDQYISEYDVAHLAQRLTNSNAKIVGEQRRPKHTIQTEKLRALGMQFGGDQQLEATITDLITAVS